MPFYKNDNGTLLTAENFVSNKDYELLIEKKDTYVYPVDGWNLFETKEEALTTFGIEEKQIEEPTNPIFQPPRF